MRADELLTELTRLLPRFRAWWDRPNNDFRDEDGSFTPCGVFSDLTGYVWDRWNEIPDDVRRDLFVFVESVVTGEPDDEIDNAACTCFLENLAGRPFSPQIRPLLGPKSLTFFGYWDFPTAG